MRFVDQVRIHAKAGDGGNGCCSFRREKFVPRGGPDGGDGGDGGDIILEADPNTDNLTALYYNPKLRSERGGHGQGKDKHGRKGASTVCKVPVGTLVYLLPDDLRPGSGSTEIDDFEEAPRVKPKTDLRGLESLVDLCEPGQRFVLCAGGRGGKGNTHFKSSTNRVPRQHTPGEPGDEGWFGLELRTIADAGLVGFPNAGKSTLLSAISAAHPKIAPYPFTTLNPVVGVVQIDNYRRATVADIPGLIEGAHENRGLGHEFLRHIVRCKILLYVLDMAGSEGRDPVSDFGTLRREIKLYDPTLSKRPSAVLANKMDLDGAEDNLRAFRAKFRGIKILPIAAEGGEGLTALRALLGELVG
ncbi:MAG: GTPase ObgE [Terrimicrobiaceae bacterium]